MGDPAAKAADLPMNASGKNEARGAADAKSKKPAAVLPPPPEEGGGSKIGGMLLTIGLLAVGGFYVWRKLNPPEPVRLSPDKYVATEKEKEWTPLVDGRRALDVAKRLCELGPRPAGSEGARMAREFLKAELAAAGISDVREQAFNQGTPIGPVDFVNLIGVLPGKRPEAIALAAHYDSKLFKEFRFVGANDAASACGLVVELARKLKAEPEAPEFTYYFVFFDGEEAFNRDWGNQEDGTPDHTYGSRYLAADSKNFPIKCLILMDMIGEQDFQLVKDDNSTPWMLQTFLETSREAFGVNFFRTENAIQDDHIPFRDAGVPVIDLIDLEFGLGKGLGQMGYWHTAEDTPDKLHPRGFDVTGTLVLKALPKVVKKLGKDLGAPK
jgi:hypothetical protein